MSILAANEKVNEGINEVMDLYVKSLGFDLNSLKDMDEDTFKVLQASFRLMDAAMELQNETARVLDDMNKKLDEVERSISRLEKKVH